MWCALAWQVWLPLANSIPGLIPRTVEGYERVF